MASEGRATVDKNCKGELIVIAIQQWNRLLQDMLSYSLERFKQRIDRLYE